MEVLGREQALCFDLRNTHACPGNVTYTRLLMCAEEHEAGATPTQKLERLLTGAKEKGMSAEKLFEHFTPDGGDRISPAAFEAALRSVSSEPSFPLTKVCIYWSPT